MSVAIGKQGFTLVEMMVVLLVIGVLLGLAIPAYNTINGAGNFKKSTYDIAGLLDQARAYAMANNTYVFVGIEEVDPTQTPAVSPSPTTAGTGTGRIVVAVVASTDGTKHYATATTNQGIADWQPNYGTGSYLTALQKLATFDNVHLAASLPPPTPPSGMARPTPGPTPQGTTNDTYMLGDPHCISTTPFTWPVGSTLTTGTYLFNKVIQFDPEGVARITFADNGDGLVQWMELALLPAHGNVPPPSPTPGVGNQAAIQINGITGATHIYQP